VSTHIQRQKPADDDLLQKLSDEVDRTACESDRKFFSSNPQRSHRLRPATWAEVSMQEEVDGAVWAIEPGRQHFTAVKQLRPGVRMRAFFSAPAVEDWVEPPEAAAAAWYEHVRPARTVQLEQGLTTVLAPFSNEALKA
jgi:hypothetical protein